MSNSTNCPALTVSAPPSYIPESGNSGSINYCVVPSGVSNDTSTRVAKCCGPNVLQVAGGCYDWCQLPDSYLVNGTATVSDIYDSFHQCLRTAADGDWVGEFQCFAPTAKSAASTVAPGVGAGLVVAWAGMLCLWQLWK